MIALHAVSKEVGQGPLRKLVLNNINWIIPPRRRIVILGQKGAGKTTLLDIVRGARFPTSGWVERKASISPGRLARGLNKGTTSRQLTVRIAQLYRVDARAVTEFTQRFADMQSLMDVPLASLPPRLRRKVIVGLIFAIPFDFYVLDELITNRNDEFSVRCRQTLQARARESGVILTTSSVRVAKEFDGSAGIIHQGRLMLFDSPDEAIPIFNALPAPDANQRFLAADEEEDDEEEWV